MESRKGPSKSRVYIIFPNNYHSRKKFAISSRSQAAARLTLHPFTSSTANCRGVGPIILARVISLSRDEGEKKLPVRASQFYACMASMIYPKWRKPSWAILGEESCGERGSFSRQPGPVKVRTRSNHELTTATKTAKPGVEIKGVLRRS
jgi:hypothetical protein